MANWVYDGYTKVHDKSRKRMVEKRCYKCSNCNYIVIIEPSRESIWTYTKCHNCGKAIEAEEE